MRISPRKQRGVSTLIMVLAVGAALATSLYGAYSHMDATGKSQDTSAARTQAQALAEDGLTASAEYLNQVFCGSPNATCTNGNVAGLSTTAIPPGTVLVNQSGMLATTVANTFVTNGEVEVDATGTTATGSAAIRGYLHDATIFTYTPLQGSVANLMKGSQNLLGNVTINTGSSHSLTVEGNLGIGGSAKLTGTANATGTITGCSDGATCNSGVPAGTIVTPAINAYNLSNEANAVLSVNAAGQAEVTIQNNSGLAPAGTTLFANFPASSTALCVAGGTACITPPANVTGKSACALCWQIAATPSPGVLFFYGDVSVAASIIGDPSASKPGYATILTTGNAIIGTNNDIVAYGQMPGVCDPGAGTTSPESESSDPTSDSPLPLNVCPNGVNETAPSEGSGLVADAMLISGGSVGYPYTGGGTVYDNGTAKAGVPAVGDSTQTEASNNTEPSGTVEGYTCSGSSAGTVSACATGTTDGILTGGEVTLNGNSNLTGTLAASESLTAKGTGTITGIVLTADTNNATSSALGSSNNDIKGNLTISYAPGVSAHTNFGGGGNTPEVAFVPLWQRYLY